MKKLYRRMNVDVVNKICTIAREYDQLMCATVRKPLWLQLKLGDNEFTLTEFLTDYDFK